MMLYKNSKAMVCPLDGDTNFLNIDAEIFLQGDTGAPQLFIGDLDYVLQTSIKENGFTLKKGKKQIISHRKGDILAPFLFRICLDYVLQTSIDLKENGFTLKKKKKKKKTRRR